MLHPLDDAELRFGDVVLNYCDPRYVRDRGNTHDVRDSSAEHLVRILVYAMFAQRVFTPANYVLKNRAFFEAVEQAPELLREGILVVHLHEQNGSFSDLAFDRDLPPLQRARAEFLDAHSKYIKPFSPTSESTLYHRRLLEDISPPGALRTLIPGARRGKRTVLLDKAALAFEREEGSREKFIDTMSKALPEYTSLFARWAALRYYLTPMELERVRIRDLPHSAASLARRSGIMTPSALEDPAESGELPEPMNAAADVMSVHMPVVASASDARCLVAATLATREAIPEARNKFAGIVSAARTLEVRHELNAALKSALLRERVLPTRAGITDHFLHSVRDVSAGTIVDLLLGKVLGALAMVGIGGAEQIYEKKKLQKQAPWRVSYETLAGQLSAGKCND